MKTGLIIPIYNRPQYVKKCFQSLHKLTTKPDVMVLIDDASTDKEINKLLAEYWNDKEVIIIKNKKNLGVRGSLKIGIERLFTEGCDIVVNLDSDAIVKHDFISKVIFAHTTTGLISGGFNIDREKVINDVGFYKVKIACNGINMCFNKKLYDEHIKPSLSIGDNWDASTAKSAHMFAITIPSVVQHIGIHSSMGHHGGDFAKDFKPLDLPNVTLFGIDSYDIQGIERAAEISQRFINFGHVNIITKDLFTKGGNTDVRRRDYSRFMLKELNKQFNTSHVLTIHADGYVVNWQAWDESWLQYDYIGATWLYKDGMNVGNGGFSLRSKKLCDILSEQHIDKAYMHPEDHCICRTYRESLEKEFGIKFAPEEVANKFSIEAYGCTAMLGANKYSGQFGFHSVHVDFNDSDIPQDMRIMAKREIPPVKFKQFSKRA